MSDAEQRKTKVHIHTTSRLGGPCVEVYVEGKFSPVRFVSDNPTEVRRMAAFAVLAMSHVPSLDVVRVDGDRRPEAVDSTKP